MALWGEPEQLKISFVWAASGWAKLRTVLKIMIVINQLRVYCILVCSILRVYCILVKQSLNSKNIPEIRLYRKYFRAARAR